MTPAEWRELSKQASMAVSAAAQPDERSTVPERAVGAGVGAASLLPLLSQHQVPSLKGVKHLGIDEAAQAVRPGDVLLTRNKIPTSGWRMFAPLFTGSPWYHAEIVSGLPGSETSHMVGAMSDPANVFRDQQSALIMRPKSMPEGIDVIEKLQDAANRLSAEEYAGFKAPAVAAARTFMPDMKALTKAPVCNGHICSTGPAAVLREIGVDPKINTVKGMELAGDYLRSPAFTPIATVGKRINPQNYMRNIHLPARALLAAGLGYGAYRAAKDVRESEPSAPIAGAAGGLAGLTAGRKLEEFAETPRASSNAIRGALRKVLGQQSLAAERAGVHGRQLFRSITNKYPLIPSAVGGVLGGIGAYGTARLLSHLYKRRQAQRAAQSQA